MKRITIIIPTWNEERNIETLVERIHATFYGKTNYQIIFIDDHSTDQTVAVIKRLTKNHPIEIFQKKGKMGKAQSLIEGFSYAKYELICVIDADLQYPPEEIPAMVEKIDKGADFVIANRKTKQTSLQRNFISYIYSLFFNKLLFGFDLDVQAGLKVFRKEIIDRIKISAGIWAIDLELLIKAKNAGYKIVSHDITFAKRDFGVSKISLVKASLEIGLNALKLRFFRSDIVPFHEIQERKKGKGFNFQGHEYIHHSSLPFKDSAFSRLTKKQGIILGIVIIGVILSFYINWHTTIVFLISILTILYFADLLFNLFLIMRSFSKPAEIKIPEGEIIKLREKDLPTYTILCPLYKEWQVVPQFVTSMSRLDYPKNKLQVMLLLEENDTKTIEQIKNFYLPSYFEIVIVPHSMPKTKPKACNYGLTKSIGEYTVIYDAEDAPEPLQLKKAILAFQKAGKQTVCIQAKLNFYNPNQNILTRVFTAEYSLWFDLILTGLQSIHAPIPLGGTSNHFRTNDLRKLQGWDSFNVTEDADLGMRLVKYGYNTAIVDSTTLEEANSDLKNWFGQRSRWIKGYMQTYLVHSRSLGEFFKKGRRSHFFTFQLVIGGKVLSMFINPVMWIITVSYFTLKANIGVSLESFFPMPVLYMGIFSLVFGNFLYLYYYMIGCTKHRQEELIKYVFLVPFYWIAMSIAAWVGLYDLLVAPHHWSKTKHGLHLQNKNATTHAASAIGNSLVDKGLISQISLVV